MGKNLLKASLLLGSAVIACVGCNSNSPKEIYFEHNININDDWQFKREEDKEFSSIDLPHDYSIRQDFNVDFEAESGYLPGGKATYFKKLVVPSNVRVILDFDGVYHHTNLYVNNQYVGENCYGYNPFAFDITDYVTRDNNTDNIIRVESENNFPSSRYYSGSGIYRDVKVSFINNVSVRHNSVKITTPNVKYGRGDVNIELTVNNFNNTDQKVYLEHSIIDDKGNEVAALTSDSKTIKANDSLDFNSRMEVVDYKLWSDLTPNLYYLKTKVIRGNNITDEVTNRFGFRYFEFNETGFHINGRTTKLKGVCLHHDQGALGADAYEDAFVRQLKKLKNMGINAIRTSHYPADSKFLRLCDEMGFFVDEEIFDMWLAHKSHNDHDFAEYFNVKLTNNNHILDGNSNMTWAEFALKETLKRDRNNPSIVLWSLGNEIGDVEGQVEAAVNLIKWVKDVDTTIPCTVGDNGRTINPDTRRGKIQHLIHDSGGVVGFNYPRTDHPEIVSGALGSFYGSETVSGWSSRSSYKTLGRPNDSKDPTSWMYKDGDGNYPNGAAVDYDIPSWDDSPGNWTNTQAYNIKQLLTKDCYAGQFMWTGFDYIGEPAPWNGSNPGEVVPDNGPRINTAYYGQIDTAGFEKDNFYLYRSQYLRDEYTLHLAGSYNPDNMYTAPSGSDYEGMVPMAIYSNAPNIRVYKVPINVPPTEEINDQYILGWWNTTTHITPNGHPYITHGGYRIKHPDNNDIKFVEIEDPEDVFDASHDLYTRFYVKPEDGYYFATRCYENYSSTIITSTTGTTELYKPTSINPELAVNVSKEELKADAHSLSYIELGINDENNRIINYTNEDKDPNGQYVLNFKLEGEGEIAGVDNGRQNESDKFQNSTVLNKDRKSAHIRAFGGKALLIVKSTHKAGEIKVTITNGNDSIQPKVITLHSAN